MHPEDLDHASKAPNPMQNIAVLRNVIQEYAWGSKSALAELLSQPFPTDNPQAEMWMGAHPKAPSQVFWDGRWRSLLELIRAHPVEILGEAVAATHSGCLPFLFKVLAAEKPLSIQVHPNAAQARSGFRRENQRGIPLDAPHRNYKDDNHKPEIICALTSFWALNGFRPVGAMLSLLNTIQIPTLAGEVADLQKQPNRTGLRNFFRHLVSKGEDLRRRAVREAVAFAQTRSEEAPLWRWMITLNQEYPEDIGVLAPLLLNLVELQPGEAMYLPAGELHAYLHGVGIELMANSDNVLRGGLTPKHIAIDELLDILNFSEREVTILQPIPRVPAEAEFCTPNDEFRLSVLDVQTGTSYRSGDVRSAEIMICTQGQADIRELPQGAVTCIAQGVSVLVPAAVPQYLIQGNARIYKASVPRIQPPAGNMEK
ncbi:MAG: mannose-6-phosphate isomerase, class I [Desulfobacterales bacterium]|nr:MAG: mannose-6-phosphate isomerase, class I [Desulfobacterales bacterium]